MVSNVPSKKWARLESEYKAKVDMQARLVDERAGRRGRDGQKRPGKRLRL